MLQFSNSNRTMEAETIKNAVTPKNHMSRGNQLKKLIVFFIAVSTCIFAYSQDCAEKGQSAHEKANNYVNREKNTRMPHCNSFYGLSFVANCLCGKQYRLQKENSNRHCFGNI